jgi:hypothetical protein
MPFLVTAGSAVLALRSGTYYYLIVTRHQAKRLRPGGPSWVYIPAAQKFELVTVVAESKNADVSILRMESMLELNVLSVPPAETIWSMDFNDAIVVYGYPLLGDGRYQELSELIPFLQLRMTHARLIGVTYNGVDGVRLVVDQMIENGESGGLAFSPTVGLIGVNQASRFGTGNGLITPFWDASALLYSLGLA